MRRRKGRTVVLSLMVFFVLSTRPGAQAPGPQVDAKAAVLLDVASEQILFEQSATIRVAPASLTKLMTVYLAYDALRGG
ncbi:MAG: D-alanyl-D-alanine carboxypeptidase, partial [candidate division NC10 bacterium]